MAEDATSFTQRTKELRLAVVCYGGVSLAIYEHGVTKELYKLVRAARAFEAAQDGGLDVEAAMSSLGLDPDGLDSERAYFAALAQLAAEGHPLTVSVDVISGTSAGGINGVCLARGLAGGRSLDGFRSLWIDEGDINTLLDGHVLHVGGRPLTKIALVDAIFHTVRHDQDSPLSGDRMCRLLHDALAGMDRVSTPLVRADQRIDLFTTTTSVHGYETAIPTGLGTVAHTDRSYAQLMHFQYESGGVSTLGDDDVAALAFAARATSSFPGAFAPVSLATFADAVDDVDEAGVERIAERFEFGLEFGATHHGQWYMDGGVLDNGPFDHAIDAIARRPAAVETAREMIYIEPDPGLPPGEEGAPPPVPGVLSTVWSARVTIPQHTPMVSVLRGLHAMNTHIASVGAIVSAQMDPVLAALDRATAGDFARPVDYESMVAQAEAVRAAAQELSGLGFVTYCRLRAAAVSDAIAEVLAAELRFPPESNRSAFIASVLTEWTHRSPAWSSTDPQALDHALSPIDLPYRIRRGYFVLQGINQSLPSARGAYRRQLLTMKRTAWDLLTELRTSARSAAAAVREAADHVFGAGLGRPVLGDPSTVLDPKRFVEAGAFGASGRLHEIYTNYVAALEASAVKGSSRRLWDVFQTETHDWPVEQRRRLLARYVGFPIWDALVFPTVAAARLPQLSPIPVTRFSPLDATLLRPVSADGLPRSAGEPKLEGVGLAHFGGFFSRHAREHDYLWGRLDGAEQILRLLARRALPDGFADAPVDLESHTRDAFRSILSSEAPVLTELGPVLAALGEQVGR